ncbi:MAG: cytochrome B [Flavobacteriales bacterium]|nr:cytochrome B [Crocinitomicaceae bacterium]NBX81265.1 cytochrome B [Flavobacteriales bacterium]
MLDILKHTHSGLRWVALILLLLAIVNAFTSSTYEKKHRLINLFAMVSLHTQLLIGLGLYFISPRVKFFDGWMKDAFYRFYGMEHISMMIIAIILVTIGHSKSKKGSTPAEKFKPIKLWYVLGLILILAAIPWPFRTALGGAWF